MGCARGSGAQVKSHGDSWSTRSDTSKARKICRLSCRGLAWQKVSRHTELTHSPSAEELRKFLPMIGCHTGTVKKEYFSAVQTMPKGMPAAKITAFLAIMAGTLNSQVTVVNHFATEEFAYFVDSSGSDQVKQFHLSVESVCNFPSQTPNSSCVMKMLL